MTTEQHSKELTMHSRLDREQYAIRYVPLLNGSCEKAVGEHS